MPGGKEGIDVFNEEKRIRRERAKQKGYIYIRWNVEDVREGSKIIGKGR